MMKLIKDRLTYQDITFIKHVVQNNLKSGKHDFDYLAQIVDVQKVLNNDSGSIFTINENTFVLHSLIDILANEVRRVTGGRNIKEVKLDYDYLMKIGKTQSRVFSVLYPDISLEDETK